MRFFSSAAFVHVNLCIPCRLEFSVSPPPKYEISLLQNEHRDDFFVRYQMGRNCRLPFLIPVFCKGLGVRFFPIYVLFLI
jgi:hypothetical protein